MSGNVTFCAVASRVLLGGRTDGQSGSSAHHSAPPALESVARLQLRVPLYLPRMAVRAASALEEERRGQANFNREFFDIVDSLDHGERSDVGAAVGDRSELEL